MEGAVGQDGLGGGLLLVGVVGVVAHGAVAAGRARGLLHMGELLLPLLRLLLVGDPGALGVVGVVVEAGLAGVAAVVAAAALGKSGALHRGLLGGVLVVLGCGRHDVLAGTELVAGSGSLLVAGGVRTVRLALGGVLVLRQGREAHAALVRVGGMVAGGSRGTVAVLVHTSHRDVFWTKNFLHVNQ
eukprot:303676_1